MNNISFVKAGIIAVLMFSLCACNETSPSNGACDAGSVEVLHRIVIKDEPIFKKQSYPLPSGKYVFYSTSGDKAQMYIYYTQANICTKKHFTVDFTVAIAETNRPFPLKITGEILWSALFPSAKVTLVEKDAQGVYSKKAEAGLKQVFGDRPAEVDIYMMVEFESQGSFDEDAIYFEDHIESISIQFTADKSTK